MGLGAWPEVSVEARDKAFLSRRRLIDGIDPLVGRTPFGLYERAPLT